MALNGYCDRCERGQVADLPLRVFGWEDGKTQDNIGASRWM